MQNSRVDNSGFINIKNAKIFVDNFKMDPNI